MWGGGSRDRQRSGQVRWAFRTEVWGGLGFRESGRASWRRVEGQCSGGVGSVLIYWPGGHGGLRTSTLPRPALLKVRLRETEGK